MIENEIPYDYNPDDYAFNRGAETSHTLASSTHDFRYENGRRYHAYRDGAYPFPNDDMSADHEKAIHNLFLLIMNDQLYLSPIASPMHIKDVGSGTGLWAFDMADRFPDATVLGVDLSPAPSHQGPPPNLELRVEDVREEWIDSVQYDFVHIRSMFGSFDDYNSLYQQIFDNMASGGYLESVEFIIDPHCDDDTFPPDSVFRELKEYSRQIGDVTGKLYDITDQMKQNKVQAGFVDIVEKKYRVPLGPWSTDPKYRDIGRWMEAYFRTGVEAWVLRPMTQYHGWTRDQVDDLCNRAFEALDKCNQHIYYFAVVVYARKP